MMADSDARSRSDDVVVARLLQELTPVRPLWSPYTRLMVWLVVEAAVLLVATRLSLRRDVLAELQTPSFLLQVAALASAGAAMAAVALHAAVPERGVGGIGMVSGVVLGVVAVLAVAHQPVQAGIPLAQFAREGARCVICEAAFAALPLAALFLALRRGAPLDGAMAGACAGAAAFLVAAAGVRLACPMDEGLHLLAWHVAPVILATALAAIAGTEWLDRWG